MYCSNCGKKLADGDYFCPNCGTPVSRQNLFDDDADLPMQEEDDLEQTKIFDNDALQAVLHDDELMVLDENEPEADEQPLRSFSRFFSEQPKNLRSINESDPFGQSASIEADEGPSNDSFVMGNTESTSNKNVVSDKLLGAFGAVTSLLHSDNKKKQQKQAEETADQAVDNDAYNYDWSDSQEQQEDASSLKKGHGSSGEVSMRKMIFPIIVIGILIGLVAGMAIIQPWNQEDDQTQTGTTGVVQTETLANEFAK